MKKKIRLFSAILFAAFLVGGRGVCEARTDQESRLKAAFIYNFAQFVEWPPKGGANEAFVIGVLGDDPIGEELDSLQNETIRQKPIRVRHLRAVEETRECDLVFVGKSRSDVLGAVLSALRESSVLTIGETPGFADEGGIIGFVIKGNKVRFVINQKNAEQKGLHVNSQLLKLAEEVIT
ncbi:MAG TPA: YfiR family protein [Candidatus Eisenbacteria bacterium]|jgi:hypothetical protein|nr:YfiR family protein [Candidatus Eisenbacteria bacterium]